MLLVGLLGKAALSRGQRILAGLQPGELKGAVSSGHNGSKFRISRVVVGLEIGSDLQPPGVGIPGEQHRHAGDGLRSQGMYDAPGDLVTTGDGTRRSWLRLGGSYPG